MTNSTNEASGSLSFDVVLITEVPIEGNTGDIAYDVTIVEKKNGIIVSSRNDLFTGNTNGTPGTVMSWIEGDKQPVTVNMPERFGNTFDQSWVEKFEEVQSVEIDGKIHYINL